MNDLLVLLIHDTNEFSAVVTLLVRAAILVDVESHDVISVRAPPPAVALTLIGSVPCGLAAKDATTLDLRGRCSNNRGNESGGNSNERELHLMGTVYRSRKNKVPLYMFIQLYSACICEGLMQHTPPVALLCSPWSPQNRVSVVKNQFLLALFLNPSILFGNILSKGSSFMWSAGITKASLFGGRRVLFLP